MVGGGCPVAGDGEYERGGPPSSLFEMDALWAGVPMVTSWNPPTISLALPSLDLGRPAADGVARVSKTESPEDCGVPK